MEKIDYIFTFSVLTILVFINQIAQILEKTVSKIQQTSPASYTLTTIFILLATIILIIVLVVANLIKQPKIHQ